MSRNDVILVVEDDLFHSRIIERTIKSVDPNAKITFLHSAEEAYSDIKENNLKYALVIADYTLTGDETGLDLWKKCEQEFPKIPFMMISSLSIGMFSNMIGGKKNTPPFLAKPFSAKDFRALYSSLLHHH